MRSFICPSIFAASALRAASEVSLAGVVGVSEVPDCIPVVVVLIVVVVVWVFVVGITEAGVDELLTYQMMPPMTTTATIIHMTIFDVLDIILSWN